MLPSQYFLIVFSTPGRHRLVLKFETMAIHAWGRPEGLHVAGFYSKENVGFVDEADRITEANTEKSHPRGCVSLWTWLLKPMVSAGGDGIHPHELNTHTSSWSGQWRSGESVHSAYQLTEDIYVRTRLCVVITL